MRQYFKIAGSSRGLPARKITAEELDQRLGLAAGWTALHTGVLVRHQASGWTEMEELVRQVSAKAMAEAGFGLGELDYLIDASLSAQQPIPCNAALLQKILGKQAAGVPCMDVHASCLGFLAALNVANGLFAAGAAKRILIICAETPLIGVNWNEPQSACLMGDGVAAVVLEAAACDFAYGMLMETFAEGAALCEVRAGGHRIPPHHYSSQASADYQFHMDGAGVHRLASRLFPPMLARVLEQAGRRIEDLQVIPHQASGPALEFMRRRLGIPLERFHVSIAEHGNLIAASLPFVLDSVRRKLGAGTPVLMLGTAAGYTQGAALFEL